MTAAPVSCNLRSKLQVGRLFDSVASKWYLGASCEPLGGLLVPLQSLLGASWGPLGSLLEASWGLLGSLGRLLGASCHKLAFECELTASWRRLGTVLGPSWARPGPLLGPPGRPLGASWSLLGLSWELLGPSWGHLAALLGVLRRKSVKYQTPAKI